HGAQRLVISAMWWPQLLLFLFVRVLTKKTKADLQFFDTGFQETVLPSIEISGNGTVLPSAIHRVYSFRDCKFRISFNAALCTNKRHKIVISFMNHWPDPLRIARALMERNVFIIQNGEDVGKAKLQRMNYKYIISVVKEGKNLRNVMDKFSDTNVHVYISIEQGNVTLNRMDYGDDGDVMSRVVATLDLGSIKPRYIAVFATHMQYCPSFISGIDTVFDVWLRGHPLNVQGQIDEHLPPREYLNTCLRDVLLSMIAIVFYYYCLTIVILPTYFIIAMPLTSHRNGRAPVTVEDEEIPSNAREKRNSDPSSSQPSSKHPTTSTDEVR
ncbi:hypothetical protein V3C99_001481, partial [Haemonchus contortus]